MSEEDLVQELPEESHDGVLAGLSAGVIRVMPMVTFGVRAAALAGLVVSAGAAVTGLGGVGAIEALGPNSTCCGP